MALVPPRSATFYFLREQTMGVIFFEGFETVGTETGQAGRTAVCPRLKQRWTEAEGSSPGSDPRGVLQSDFQSEGFCWRTSDTGGSTANFQVVFPDEVLALIAVPFEDEDAEPMEQIIGFRIHTRNLTDGASILILRTGYRTNSLVDTFSSGIGLRLVGTATGITLEIIRGASTELAEAIDALNKEEWHYIEMKFLLRDTGGVGEPAEDGYVIVNVDGVEVINFVGDTDADSANAGQGLDYVGFRFGFSGGSATGDDYWALDDVYAMSPDAAPYNDFLGQVRVVRFELEADSTAEWTPSVEGNHYELVDENGADDSDYIESDTTGQSDTYTIENFGGGGTVYALKAEAEAINTVGGTPILNVSIDGTFTAYTVDDTVDYQVFTHYVDIDGFDDSEVGVQFDSGF